jgi:hypothetical protein
MLRASATRFESGLLVLAIACIAGGAFAPGSRDDGGGRWIATWTASAGRASLFTRPNGRCNGEQGGGRRPAGRDIPNLKVAPIISKSGAEEGRVKSWQASDRNMPFHFDGQLIRRCLARRPCS